MEMTILLLLTVPLTTASPVTPVHRTESQSFSSDSLVQTEVSRPDGAEEGRVPEPRIIPFSSEGRHPDLEALKNSIPVKSRPRRAPQRGCQLGTCQLHNLASTLYQIGKTSGKDESKRAHDPQGYGR
ncbi:uncharacterized protein ACJ7VT_005500 [Polymixia lowei]